MYILYIHIPIYNPTQSYTQCTNIRYRILWSIRLQEVLSCLILWVGATWCYGLLKVLSLKAVCQSLVYVACQKADISTSSTRLTVSPFSQIQNRCDQSSPSDLHHLLVLLIDWTIKLFLHRFPMSCSCVA